MSEPLLIAVVGGLFGLLGVLLPLYLKNRQPASGAAPNDVSAGSSTVPDQVAAVCFRRPGPEVELLLVRSDGGRWLFPKGKIKSGEQPELAAEREALEEGGVSGRIRAERLARFIHHKRGFKRAGRDLVVDAYLLEVPESQVPTDCERGREPTWVSATHAKELLSENRAPAYAQAYARVVDAAVRTLGASRPV